MIDIVIPVYNQFLLVCQCVDALLAQSMVGRVIIVDDASTQEHLLDYYDYMGFDVVFNDENVGFLGSANRGMELVEAEYAIIVNSDVVPLSKRAVSDLVFAMDDTQANVGSGLLLHMPGKTNALTIQHAGVGFNPEGVPYHPFMGLHRDTKAAKVSKRVNAVSGAVFAVRMSRWRELGGFDPVYGRGVYEDVDYCLRAQRVLYEPKSEWLHLMHGSQVPHAFFGIQGSKSQLLCPSEWIRQHGRCPRQDCYGTYPLYGSGALVVWFDTLAIWWQGRSASDAADLPVLEMVLYDGGYGCGILLSIASHSPWVGPLLGHDISIRLLECLF
jgi:glycosyltransferase involved in cell wall biosynthesis